MIYLEDGLIYLADSLDNRLNLPMNTRYQAPLGGDEFDNPEVGPEQIEDVEIEDEVTDIAVLKQLTKMLNNELSFPEFHRGYLNFKIRSSGESVSGIPLAKLADGDSFLFKTKSGMKKVKITDMIPESYSGQETFVSETFKDYE